MIFLQNLFLFLFMITILVFVHEYGHYYFAKKFGVFVEKFSLGFGKAVYSKKDKHGTVWAIAPIPLGGFVKMRGEMNYSQAESSDNSSFNSKTLWQKTIIVGAGPFVNLVFGFLLFLIFGLFASAKQFQPVVGSVLEDSPAHIANMQINDEIVSINGQSVKTWADISQTIAKQDLTQNLNIVLKRDESLQSISLKAIEQETEQGKRPIIGISYSNNHYTYSGVSFSKALSFSFNVFVDLNKEIISWLKRAFLGKVALDEVGGPVKIAQVSGDFYNAGILNWIFFIGALSINLAIINLLPIPALDGGHIMFYAIEAITRRKVPAKIIGFLSTLSFFVLMSFMLLITLRDVLELF